MKRKWTTVLSLVFVLVMAVSLTACGSKYSRQQLKPEGSSSGSPKSGKTAEGQLSEDDIQAMNGGEANIIYGDPDEDGNRYVTFIDGKYYDKKVKDQEDAVRALQGIAQLIGFGKGSEFFANYGERDANNYTYWVLQQKYGSSTVQYATIRVVVDPEGYVCALSSSAVPNLGISNSSDGIGAEAAAEVAKQVMAEVYPNAKYKLYEDSTREIVAEYWKDDCFYHCYAVYTSNPDVSNGETFDLPYLEHVITYEGKEIACNAVDSLTGGETPEVQDNSAYFANLEPAVWEGDLTMNDGSKRHVVVPVAKSTVDGNYYLADVERKILLADYNAFVENTTDVRPITSPTNSGWETYMLMDLYNYGRAYDFYKEIGIYGSDTFGTPMLILVNWTEDGAAVNNACNMGHINGWLCCGASSEYYYEESLDVIAHEFTHGVTSTEMLGNMYRNEQGAINEAFSDIMGEICEQMAKRPDGSPEVTDPDWYHGQGKPEPGRCMSDPNQFDQPGAVGDIYYIVPGPFADNFNDGGGNHFNSSLLNYVAWTLYDKGLPLEDERDLWFTTSALMTPRSDYDEVLGALLMSVRINGLDKKWGKVIEDTYEELGLVGDRLENAYHYTRDDCGSVSAKVELNGSDKVSRIVAYQADLSTGSVNATMHWFVPDENRTIRGLLPAGTWGFELWVSNADDSRVQRYVLTTEGTWSSETRTFGAYEIKAGKNFDLGTITVN